MTNPTNPQVKPKPEHLEGDGITVCICGKCAGTGLYVMEMRNGRPWSATGTTCWSCNGLGWKQRKPRRTRCPKCELLGHKGETHEFWRRVNPDDEHLTTIVCDGLVEAE